MIVKAIEKLKNKIDFRKMYRTPVRKTLTYSEENAE